MTKLDTVTLNIIHNALTNIASEMALVMLKTSYSTIFNEGLDFCTVLLDRNGDLIAEKNYAPAMMGAVPHTVKWAIDDFRARGIENPRLDAELLVAHALGIDRMRVILDARERGDRGPLYLTSIQRFHFGRRRRIHRVRQHDENVSRMRVGVKVSVDRDLFQIRARQLDSD